MKNTTWIIEKYIFDEYEDRLVNAIKDSGSKVMFYDELNNRDKNLNQFLNDNLTIDDIVIFHGSLQLGRQISRMPYYPAVFMNIDNYECYKYYGHYGTHLLNSDYLMMGLNDVVRNRPLIKKTLIENSLWNRGKENKIFIRPSNGYKSFAGQLISFDNLEREIDILKKSYGGVDPETLVLLSKTQNITEEYRFIVVDGKVITGSLYMDCANRESLIPYYKFTIGEDDESFKYAQRIVDIYQPDKAYTIDICMVDNGDYHMFKLLEINSFNCASMYGASYEKVVEAINNLAVILFL